MPVQVPDVRNGHPVRWPLGETIGRWWPAWSRFSEVAAANPYACCAGPFARAAGHRPQTDRVSYPKYMNSNNDVDMGATLIMCSAEKACAGHPPRSLGVPHSGTDCHEHQFISNRWSPRRPPSRSAGGWRWTRRHHHRRGGDRRPASCFPSAVQLGAQSLGLPLDRQLTRTGGWRSPAAVERHARHRHGDERPASSRAPPAWCGPTAATPRNAFGVYRTTPPAGGFQHAYPQDVIDAMPPRTGRPRRRRRRHHRGVHRDAQPRRRTETVRRLPAGRRPPGVGHQHAPLAAAMCEGEWVGRPATLDPDGIITPV